MAFITIEGENKIALQQGSELLLNITHFVLANIAGLGAEPADRIETLPAPGDIVDTRLVSRSGYVNTNQVVYSLSLDSTVGDYTFNWVGIKDADDVLIAVVYLADPITKTATSGGIDGNNLVRNFLLQYSGIQATTAISAPAETWQIDFTTRLLQIDERERLSNFDIYGPDAFFDDGFDVTLNSGTIYNVNAGVGYVDGIRAELATTQTIDAAPLPSAIWVDASLQGDINGVTEVILLSATNSTLVDYIDGNGFQHYLTKIADISVGGIVTDTRTSAGFLNDHETDPNAHPQFLTEPEADLLYDVLGGLAAHAAAPDPHPQYNSILPFSALAFPTIDTTDNRITVTPATASNGGTGSIPANIMIAVAEEMTAGKTGLMKSVETAAYTSADLNISSTYFLRGTFVNGVWTVYTQKGTDSDSIPAGLVGTPNGASGGGFDSTVLDILLAKVVTGIAGTVPVITELANSAYLDIMANEIISSVNVASWTNAALITLDWARSPVLTGASMSQVASSDVPSTADVINTIKIQLASISRYSVQPQFWTVNTAGQTVVGINSIARA